jgi:hypothetical protein
MSQATEIVRSAYAACAAGDIETVLSIFSPAIRWSEAAGGPYGGVFKATGKRLKVPFAHVWKFRNGQAVSFDQYTDTAVHRAAMR